MQHQISGHLMQTNNSLRSKGIPSPLKPTFPHSSFTFLSASHSSTNLQPLALVPFSRHYDPSQDNTTPSSKHCDPSQDITPPSSKHFDPTQDIKTPSSRHYDPSQDITTPSPKHYHVNAHCHCQLIHSFIQTQHPQQLPRSLTMVELHSTYCYHHGSPISVPSVSLPYFTSTQNYLPYKALISSSFLPSAS